MKAHRSITTLSVALLAAVSMSAQAFDSGSTGADGAFNPTVDTVLPLPDDGVFNFTSLNIPAGVTVRFERNALNTPVRILVAGDALIDGVINLNGSNSPATGSAGDGVIADDGLPGRGGPGGFDGGVGGSPGSSDFAGGHGVGPGGGFPSESQLNTSSSGRVGCAGGGGGFGANGILGRITVDGFHCAVSASASGGPSYGNERLLPLIGGSGGGGGAGGVSFAGSGGGGGGGAILIAVSGTLTVNGAIRANGGNSGATAGAGTGGPGGGGAGGGIRLIASTLAGGGAITAQGGSGATNTNNSNGGGGGVGRIRLEAEIMNRSAGTTPQFSFAEPGPVFLTGMPSIRIASVGGTDAPAVPSGTADIVLPVDFPNPVDIVVEAFNVPLGNTATVTLAPATGRAFSVITNALDGTEAASSAMAQIEVPDGPSTLLASVSFTVTEDQNMAFQHITDGEPVREVRLLASLDGLSRTVLITEAGREVEVPGGFLR